MRKYTKFIGVQLVGFYFCFFFFVNVSGYGSPQLGLGFTNILDGGPVRPFPGLYWQQWLQFYTTKRFLNAQGKPLNDVASPRFRDFSAVTEFFYQFDYQLPWGGMPGFVIALPVVLYSKIARNELGIADSGSGFGDLYLGAYTQWSAIEWRGRPFFIHRFEVNMSIPMGKNKLPQKQINPSDTFFYGGTNWSATLYLSHAWSVSWALHYVWSAKNEKINFQSGDLLYCNFSLAYEAYPHLFVGPVGYALGQLHDHKSDGVSVRNSKERVFAVGPGVGYFFSQDIIFFSYLYLEGGARNHTQGTNLIARLVMHF